VTDVFVEWLENDLQRRSATQRGQVEAAKLLAALGLASAGTFVASALEVNRHRSLELAASLLIGATFLAVVLVVLLDRTTVPDHEAIIIRAGLGDLPDDGRLKDLQREAMISVLNNDAVVRQVRWSTGVALLLALASAVLAVCSLLA
jgi:hypothetical protein